MLALAFSGSGAAALLAEQAFEKLLGTLIGTSTAAGAVVLATYFAGLTIGSFLYARGRSRRRRTTALAIYGRCEAFVALWATALALAFDRLVPVFAPILRLGGTSAGGLFLARLVVAAMWILPLTVPMGATFPAIVDALDDLPAQARKTALSAFYALNLFGAIAAASLGPFVAFPRLGVDGVLLSAAALDGGAAVIAFLAARASASFEGGPTPEPTERKAPAPRVSLSEEAPLLVVAATSGFVLFALEVVWTHLVGAVLGSSVYAFATMLAVVLAGLGLGAAMAGAVAARLGRVPPYLPGAALWMGASLLAATHASWPEAPHRLAEIGREATTFTEAQGARAMMAVRLLLGPATALGAVYPLLLRLDAFPRAGAGPTAGRMAAMNAVGCIAGALAVGYVVIPALGSDHALRVLAGMCVVAGAFVVILHARGRARAAIAAASAVALVLLAWLPPWDVLRLTTGENVYFHRMYVFDGTRLLSAHEDTAGGFTTVVENAAAGKRARFLLTNGKFQGNDGGEMDAQDAFALAPMQFVRRWDDALVIGLGTGRSASVVRAMGFSRVTIAEIAPGIVDAARREFAHINGGVVDAPNTRLVVEDGRNLLLLEDRQYDLVTMEVTSVWFANSTNVYSREFYALARSRLRPGGVLQQWIQIHHIGLEDLETVIATIRDVFANVSLFISGRQGVLVASDDPQVVGPEYLRRLEANAAAGPSPSPDAVASRALRIASSRVLAPADVDRLVLARHPASNTDRDRRLEYTTPRYDFERRDLSLENLRALAERSSFEAQRIADDAQGPIAEALREVNATSIRRAIGLP